MRAVQGLEDSARSPTWEAGSRFSMGVLLTAPIQFLGKAWIIHISNAPSIYTPSPFHAVLRRIRSFCPIVHREIHAEEAVCPIGIALC